MDPKATNALYQGGLLRLGELEYRKFKFNEQIDREIAETKAGLKNIEVTIEMHKNLQEQARRAAQPAAEPATPAPAPAEPTA